MGLILAVGFFGVLGLNLYATGRRKPMLVAVTKPLLTLIPLGLYLSRGESLEPFVVLGLLAGCAGDVFLMLPEKGNRFAFGLVSFLVGHLCYIAAFVRVDSLTGLDWWFYGPALAYVALGIGLFAKLSPFLGPAKPFVTAYLVVILTMGIASLTARTVVPGVGYWIPVTGALLFVVSDSLIAFAKFTGAQPREVVVMLLYGLAQFLLTLYFGFH